jgi:hypothetical protein
MMDWRPVTGAGDSQIARVPGAGFILADANACAILGSLFLVFR